MQGARYPDLGGECFFSVNVIAITASSDGQQHGVIGGCGDNGYLHDELFELANELDRGL